MSKNPIINAAAAIGYIVILAVVMFYGTKNLPKEDTFLAPITAMALFTLSAAVMAYIFGYSPLILLLEGKKKEAVNLFLKTVGVFAIVTIGILFLLFSGIIK